MDRKKIIVLLVISNLIFVLCLVFLLVSNKKGNIAAPVVSKEVTIAGSKDANSQAQSSKTAVKPEDIIACFGVGKEQRRLKAMEDYSQVIRAEPPYLGELTEVYTSAKNGQWDKAQAICERSLQYSEDKREALYSLAWIHTKQGRYMDAIKILEQSIRDYPEFIKSYIALGWIHAKEGRYDEAVSVCKKIIKVAPDTATGHYALGRLYAIMNEPNGAIASYSESIRIKPDAEEYLFLGLTYGQQGRWSDAIKALSDSITFDRYYEQAYLFRAIAYEELGMYKEESEDLEQAVNLTTLRSNKKENWRVFGLEPDYAKVNSALAEAYARTGDYGKAVLFCKDAIAINPAYPEAYYNMALTYLLLGEKKSALEQRDKLMSLKAQDMVTKLDGLLNK
jgi:tetratricopeptide (TPR) repeat protein